MGTSEYFYAIHNTIYDNAGSTCVAQGSGISYFMPFALTNYTPTADDQINPNFLIGSFESPQGFFHNVVEWNVTYNNALTQCGNASSPTIPTATGSSWIRFWRVGGTSKIIQIRR